MGWREVFQMAEKEEKGKQAISDSKQVSHVPLFPPIASYTDWYESEERAAIMEYDGGLSREEAERLARIH